MTEIPAPYGEQRKIEAQLGRVFQAAGCSTHRELAKILAIPQSAIANARRRGSIPSDWLIALLRLRGINPDWILLGSGPKFLTPSDDPEDASSPYETFPPVRAVDAFIVRQILSCFPTRDLTTELMRRNARSE